MFSWIDIQAPDITPLNEVLRRMDIDLVLTSHFDRPEVLPRIVERSDCLAFYLYPIYEPETHLDTAQTITEIEFARMILVLGADYVITYHRRRLDAVDQIKETCIDSFRLAGKTPGFIAFLFLQRCLYDYAHLNLANDNYLDLLEAELAAGGGGVPAQRGHRLRQHPDAQEAGGEPPHRADAPRNEAEPLRERRQAERLPRDAPERAGHPRGGRLVPRPPRRDPGRHPGGGGQPDERDRPGADRSLEHHAAR